MVTGKGKTASRWVPWVSEESRIRYEDAVHCRTGWQDKVRTADCEKPGSRNVVLEHILLPFLSSM